jgi:hypothetical protein
MEAQLYWGRSCPAYISKTAKHLLPLKLLPLQASFSLVNAKHFYIRPEAALKIPLLPAAFMQQKPEP